MMTTILQVLNKPSEISVRCLDGNEWELESAVTYQVFALGDDGENWLLPVLTVPAGYVTDGASIPRFLLRVAGHPLMFENIAAAILHDYCFTHRPRLDGARVTLRDSADLYRAVRLENGASAWTIRLHRIGILSASARRLWDSHDAEFADG